MSIDPADERNCRPHVTTGSAEVGTATARTHPARLLARAPPWSALMLCSSAAPPFKVRSRMARFSFVFESIAQMFDLDV